MVRNSNAPIAVRTVLKAPVPVKPKSLPSALAGEQYELLDADDAPLPSELLAAQPKYIAIKCRLCGTLMYATEAQVGKQLTCPDCSMRKLVERPVEPKAKREVLVSDQDAYQLDESAPPPIVPRSFKQSTRGCFTSRNREAELAREAAELRKAKRLVNKPTSAVGR